MKKMKGYEYFHKALYIQYKAQGGKEETIYLKFPSSHHCHIHHSWFAVGKQQQKTTVIFYKGM